MAVIYIVTSGSYSDYGIRAVFTDKAQAETYAKQRSTGGYGDDHEVEEWPLDQPVGQTCRYKVTASKPDALYLSVYDPVAWEEAAPPPAEAIRLWDGLNWRGERYKDPSIQVEFLIEATDPDHARKIGGEKIALAFSGQCVYPVIEANTDNARIGHASLVPAAGGWTLHFAEGQE